MQLKQEFWLKYSTDPSGQWPYSFGLRTRVLEREESSIPGRYQWRYEYPGYPGTRVPGYPGTRARVQEQPHRMTGPYRGIAFHRTLPGVPGSPRPVCRVSAQGVVSPEPRAFETLRFSVLESYRLSLDSRGRFGLNTGRLPSTRVLEDQ
eukprot:1309992-Rhodomonas_salina.2